MHDRIPERTAIRLKIMLYDEGFAGRVLRKMRDAYYKTKDKERSNDYHGGS